MHHSDNDVHLASKTPVNVGNMNMGSLEAACKESSCRKSVVTVLGGQHLCLDHFFDFCYERLDFFEPRVRGRSLQEKECLAVGAFLEECLNRALFISLRHEHLTNLDRSRLLNILLLSGDLHLFLRELLAKPADSISHTRQF